MTLCLFLQMYIETAPTNGQSQSMETRERERETSAWCPHQNQRVSPFIGSSPSTLARETPSEKFRPVLRPGQDQTRLDQGNHRIKEA